MTTGFICSSWDLLHPGHLYTIHQCYDHCDHLFVGLHSDPSVENQSKNKPVETLFERWYRLTNALSGYESTIVPYDTEQDLINLLYIIKPDVRFLGSDYECQIYTGDEIGIPLILIPRYHTISSSSIRSRIARSHTDDDRINTSNGKP